MHRWLLAGLTVMLLCGCKATPAQVVEESMANMEEFQRIMDEVNNEESAQAAVAKIEQLGPRWKATVERAKALGEPPMDEKVRLSGKTLEYSRQHYGRMSDNLRKLDTYPVLREARQRALGDPSEMPKWMTITEPVLPRRPEPGSRRKR
jgi:hypothetical protein